jgi:hypothetical protein
VNWIDLQGIRRGAALVRVAHPSPKGLVRPTGRVVKLKDLERELPNAARIGPDARRAQIDTRRRQMTRLLLGSPLS